ncbi:MAG: FAD-dependent oxidoreductase [Clostridia bacterium]|nr:FAD-dependent oxidoreductase [Clostridia bacterium]
MYILEPERKTPVIGEYDVAVCGGGVAGVAAALAAARHGAKVLLIEKQFALGGLATLGLVTIYLPLCDGLGRQVSFDIAEELLRVSIQHGWEDKYPAAWLENGTAEEKQKRRFEVQYNASAAAILWEQLLRDTGVELLYGTSVCAVQTENDRITALVLENKSGRQAVRVGAVADCTGDADLYALCGAETALYEQKNVLAAWYYELKDGALRLRPLGYCDTPNKYKTPEQIAKDTRKRYQSIDGKEISEQVIEMHAWQLRAFLKDGDFSMTHNMTSIGTIPQVRMTRRLCGEYTMDDTEMHTEFSDSVGLFSDWRKAGPVYELPFGTLYNRKVKNLAAAGRCISVTDDMWDITRVIPVCAVSGQAVGTALAMHSDLTEIDIAALQNTLRADGVVLHEREL